MNRLATVIIVVLGSIALSALVSSLFKEFGVPPLQIQLVLLKTKQSFWPTSLQTWVEIGWRIAIIAGGIFAYYKFRKGREFADRVNPALPIVDVSREGGTRFLRVTATAKNIGLSMVKIDHSATCITVELRYRGAADFWRMNGKWSVFQVQKILEANEELGDSVTIPLPAGDYPAAKVNLDFFRTTRNPWWSAPEAKGRNWRATKIVDLTEAADPVQVYIP